MLYSSIPTIPYCREAYFYQVYLDHLSKIASSSQAVIFQPTTLHGSNRVRSRQQQCWYILDCLNTDRISNIAATSQYPEFSRQPTHVNPLQSRVQTASGATGSLVLQGQDTCRSDILSRLIVVSRLVSNLVSGNLTTGVDCVWLACWKCWSGCSTVFALNARKSTPRDS